MTAAGDRGTGAALVRRTTARARGDRIATAYLYLLPALLVMGVITLYPLLYQVWMSFTDFGLKNLSVGTARAEPSSGSTTTSTS